jgi:hypothetical protein
VSRTQIAESEAERHFLVAAQIQSLTLAQNQVAIAQEFGGLAVAAAFGGGIEFGASQRHAEFDVSLDPDSLRLGLRSHVPHRQRICKRVSPLPPEEVRAKGQANGGFAKNSTSDACWRFHRES